MAKNDFIKNGSEAVNPVPYQESRDDEFYCLSDGLTKREHFAGLAMQSVLNKYSPWEQGDFDSSYYEVAARNAVGLADALLKELEKRVNK